MTEVSVQRTAIARAVHSSVDEIAQLWRDKPVNGLAAAKRKVMDAVSYIQKTRTQGLNYSFASESDVINALRPAMIEHGLVLTPCGVEILHDEMIPTKSGGNQRRVTIRRQFRLTHAESGESEVLEALGEAADSGDKAVGKSLTHAKKYLLRETFLLECGDDPDFMRTEEDQETRLHLLRFSTSLNEAKTIEDLDKRLAKAEDAMKAGKISEDQLLSLREIYLTRRNNLTQR